MFCCLLSRTASEELSNIIRYLGGPRKLYVKDMRYIFWMFWMFRPLQYITYVKISVRMVDSFPCRVWEDSFPPIIMFSKREMRHRCTTNISASSSPRESHWGPSDTLSWDMPGAIQAIHFSMPENIGTIQQMPGELARLPCDIGQLRQMENWRPG